MSASWSLQSPTAPGAIALIVVSATDQQSLSDTAARLGIDLPDVGRYRVADLMGVDHGVVARWTEHAVHLFPHGGVGVVRALAASLERAGLRRRAPEPTLDYPESASPLEARMLSMLARAKSPRAVDLLLDQPRRWAGIDPATVVGDTARERALVRLIEPPSVVLLGAPNIGKSTLMNALAGAGVSIVADESGTTRDHVGAAVQVDGLTVRLIDTAGIDRQPDVGARGVASGAVTLAHAADLVLLCGDAANEPPAWPRRAHQATLRVALRSDLGEASWESDARASAAAGDGIAELGALVRRTLVPDAALSDPRPWRFWAGVGEDSRAMDP